jgi:hypothetical protein
MGAYTHTTVRHLTANQAEAVHMYRDNLAVTKLGKTFAEFAGTPEDVIRRINAISDARTGYSDAVQRAMYVGLSAISTKIHRGTTYPDSPQAKNVTVDHVEFDDADAPDLHRGQPVDIQRHRRVPGTNKLVPFTERAIVRDASSAGVTVWTTEDNRAVFVGATQCTPVDPAVADAEHTAKVEADTERGRLLREVEEAENAWHAARKALDDHPTDYAVSAEQEAHDLLADAKEAVSQCLTAGCRVTTETHAHCPEHREPDAPEDDPLAYQTDHERSAVEVVHAAKPTQGKTPVSAVMEAMAERNGIRVDTATGKFIIRPVSIELGDRVRYADDDRSVNPDLGTVVPAPQGVAPVEGTVYVCVDYDRTGTPATASYGLDELALVTKLRDVTRVTDISQVRATVAANLTSQYRVVDAWGRVHAPRFIGRELNAIVVGYADGDRQMFDRDEPVMVLRIPGQS